ncbi:Mitochondrial distribution and morphology protein 10 [Staphylotrichum longicolle]|uniref:Mitochondrial distribution and morphology protein 10 n=1 Tax=Staphylotrichum longicolle TaxID=669026 RepID=A0AAD4F3M0_9PEZI|nr:Mitochondrial distribution and morphology protein 10 [Staphylotrichum longicolle]
MREFMHYITNAFYGATGWNEDNTYQELNATARGSYQLGSIGIVDGSISYLHSTVPLTGVAAQSERIPLPALLRSYRRLHELGSRERQRYWGTEITHDAQGAPAEPAASTTTAAPDRSQCKNGSSLFYGRLYLPQSLLEGLVVRRFTPALQVQLSAVSERSLRNGGTLLGLVQYDKGKYGIEGLASTDGGLLGVRGLYNFGGDTSSGTATPVAGTAGSETNGNGQSGERDRIYGRFSAGGELYYGTLNKSGGMSLGARFATLPTHRGTPLTATLTINPLMGSINATYAVLAKDYCSLATRMEFNVYSYESEWSVGTELWSNRRPAGFLLGADPNSQPEPDPEPPRRKERSFQAKLEWRLDDPEPELDAANSKERTAAAESQEEYRGVLKARLDQNLRIGLLWEGRVKSLIFSLGTGVDLRKLGEPFRSLGLEIQYSS